VQSVHHSDYKLTTLPVYLLSSLGLYFAPNFFEDFDNAEDLPPNKVEGDPPAVNGSPRLFGRQIPPRCDGSITIATTTTTTTHTIATGTNIVIATNTNTLDGDASHHGGRRPSFKALTCQY
jgi:hypothetical protein